MRRGRSVDEIGLRLSSILTIALASCLAGPFARAQAGSSALSQSEVPELLTGLADTFAQRPPYRAVFNSEDSLEEGPSDEFAARQQHNGEMRWDGQRAEFVQWTETWHKESKKLVHVTDDHFVWTGESGMGERTYYALPDSKYPAVSEEAYTTKAKFHDSIRPDSTGWYADGILIGSDHFSTTLLGSRNLTAYREAGQAGEGFIHFSGDGELGRLDVWVDGNDPKLFRKAKFVAGNDFIERDPDMSAISFDIEVLSYVDVAGHLFPSEAKELYTSSYKQTSGKVTFAFTTKRSDYEIDPDFDAIGAFQLHLPEKTIVVDYDNANVKYFWSEGRLKAYVDPRVDESIDRLMRDFTLQITNDAKTPPSAAQPTKQAIDEVPVAAEQSAQGGAFAIYVVGAVAALLVFSTLVFVHRRLKSR